MSRSGCARRCGSCVETKKWVFITGASAPAMLLFVRVMGLALEQEALSLFVVQASSSVLVESFTMILITARLEWNLRVLQ